MPGHRRSESMKCFLTRVARGSDGDEPLRLSPVVVRRHRAPSASKVTAQSQNHIAGEAFFFFVFINQDGGHLGRVTLRWYNMPSNFFFLNIV